MSEAPEKNDPEESPGETVVRDRHALATASLIPDSAWAEARRDARADTVELPLWRTEGGASPQATGSVAPAFDFVRQVGRGGMGEVWEAVQVSMDRPVAVKRMQEHRLGTGSGDVRRRDFVIEALIAGSLEHPNILPIYDLGRDENGGPMLAMKLIGGGSWSQAILDDFPALAPERFLARHIPILISVAQAVAFAHSRGVVHRDIKPAQVMLGEYGEVVLMDWGLAIVLEDRSPRGDRQERRELELPTPRTASSPAGTPALMAPEQTSSTALEVGPWTDIYLLGGTLYYLLAGTYPFEAPSQRAAMDRASRRDFQPPSVAARRRPVPAGLEETCLRAMAAKPAERFASAREFIEALQAFLAGSTHQKESAALTMRVSEMARRADGRYDVYRECLDLLKGAADLWPSNPDLPPLRATVHEGFARAAVAAGDLVLARIEAERLPEGATRRELASRIAARERELVRRARQRRQAIAAAFALFGLVIIVGGLASFGLVSARDAAQRRADAARDARRESDDLVRFMLSDLRARIARVDPDLSILSDLADRAAKLYARRAEGAADMSRADILGVHASLLEMSEILRAQGNSREAGDLLGRALNLATLAGGAVQSGSFEARRAYARTVVALGRVHSSEGQVLDALNDLRGARRVLESLAEQQPRDASLQDELRELYRDLGAAEGDSGDLKAAAEWSRHAQRIAAALAAAAPRDPRNRLRLAVAVQDLGSIAERRGDFATALARYFEATSSLELLAREFPSDDDASATLAEAYSALGDRLKGEARAPEAVEVFAKSLAIGRKLLAANPQDSRYRSIVELAHIQTGDAFKDLSRATEAEAEYGKALEVAELAAAEFPYSIRRKLGVARALRRLASVALVSHDARGQAIDRARRALELYEAAADSNPANLGYRIAVGQTEAILGDLLFHAGVLAGAAANLDAARQTYEELCHKDPANAFWKDELRLLLGRLAAAHEAQGCFEEAGAAAARQLALARERVASVPEETRWEQTLVWPRRVQARLLASMGSASGGMALMQEQVAFLRHRVATCEALAGGSGPIAWNEDLYLLAVVQLETADLALALGRPDESEVLLGEFDAAKGADWTGEPDAGTGNYLDTYRDEVAARLALAAGRPEQALELATRASVREVRLDTLPTEVGNWQWAVLRTRLDLDRARAECVLGRTADAARTAERGLAALQASYGHSTALRILRVKFDLLSFLGRHQEAESTARELAAHGYAPPGFPERAPRPCE